jgi:hypothetical protein
MEGRARGAPLCKNILFVSGFSSGREKNRENREKRGESRLCCSPSSHCKEAFHINTIRAVFPACYSVYVDECLYVFMIFVDVC